MKTIIKLALVDDHIIMREALAQYLMSGEDISIIFTASSLEELRYKIKGSELPDVILMDYTLEKEDGDDCIKYLRSNFGQDIKILGLSMHTEIGIIYKMLEAGINGFLSKSSDPKEIKEAIQIVYSEGMYLNKFITPKFLSTVNTNKNKLKERSKEGYESLTITEKKIIYKICELQSSEEIADQLNLSHHTIKGYRKEILKKTNCSNPVEIVLYAIKNGIYPLK